MRIAIDAMGGDYAPREIVSGAVEYLRQRRPNIHLTLVGNSSKIEKCLGELKASNMPIQVVHASQVVEMRESPVLALRKKKDSSISSAIRMAARGDVDAVVTAGNTGAAAAVAKIEWDLLPEIDRPAIAALIPGPFGATVLVDAGATVNCKANNLLQFAHMGACYAQSMLHRTHPVIGLLSVGEEDVKGNMVTKEAFRLLRESKLQFYGNVEGQDVFSGKVDVIVCDGFVGNVALKVMEGMAYGVRMMFERHAYPQTWIRSLQRLLLRPLLWRVGKKFDASRFGGAPLLGVSGICVCAHGNSKAHTISNAIERAREAVSQQLNTRITESIKNR